MRLLVASLVVTGACARGHVLAYRGPAVDDQAGLGDVAVLDDGDVVVTGCLNGTLVLAEDTTLEGGANPFVARLDRHGRPRWARVLPVRCDAPPRLAAHGAEVALASAHGVDLLDAATGETRWTVEADARAVGMIGDDVVAGGRSLVRISADGELVPQGALDDEIVDVADVAPDGDGGAWVVGRAPDGMSARAVRVDHDGAVITSVPFVARTRALNIAFTSWAFAVAADGAGGAYVGGWLGGAITFAGEDLGTWARNGGMVAYVAHVDAQGRELWLRALGDTGCHGQIVDVVATPDGVVALGEVGGVADVCASVALDGHRIGVVDDGDGRSTTFVLALDAQGAVRSTRSFSGRATPVALADGGGGTWSAGSYEGTLHLAGHTLHTTERSEIVRTRMPSDPSPRTVWSRGEGLWLLRVP